MQTTRVHRRTFLGVGVAGGFGLAACAVTDPVIRPPDGRADRKPPAPALTPEIAEAWVAENAARTLFDRAAALASGIGAPSSARAWATGTAACHQAHTVRLLVPDPVLAGGDPLPAPLTTPPPAQTWTAWSKAESDLAATRQTALVVHTAHALDAAGQDQPLALLHASMATCCAGPLAGPVPVQGPAEPTAFAPTTRAAVAGVVLTRVWSLVYALEVGAGRLDQSSKHRAAGLARLDETRQVRDDMLSWPELKAAPEQLPDYDLGGAMDTTAHILAAWARQELALLGAWGRLMAASTGDDAKIALEHMLRQGVQVRRWGVGLPFWPGWA